MSSELDCHGTAATFRMLSSEICRDIYAAFFQQRPEPGHQALLKALRGEPAFYSGALRLCYEVGSNVQMKTIDAASSGEYHYHDEVASPIPAVRAIVQVSSKLCKLRIVLPKNQKMRNFMERLQAHLNVDYKEVGSGSPL